MELVIRQSDTPDILKKRLAYFHTQIDLLMSAAQELYNVKVIDTESSLTDLRTAYDTLWH